MRVGPFEVEAQIGQGGMGSVYRARGADGRIVAVKLLRPGPQSADQLARFDRERRLLAELERTEGFVPLLDAGQCPQGPWLAMELVPGGTLSDRLARGPLAVAEAIALVTTIARAVGRAHERGIVHRDLKPSNVLFTQDGRPLVSDLGLSKHFGTPGGTQSVALSKTGELRGTVGYMAPEQISDAKNVGPQADVFSLGAILHECLTGTPAFQGDSTHAVLAKVATGERVPVRTLRPEVPRGIATVIDLALAPDPSRRPRDGADLAGLLEAPPRNRGPLVAVVSVVLLAAGVAGVAHFLTGGAPPTPPPPAPVLAPPPSSSQPAVRPEQPSWYLALPKTERPPLPLPKGIVFGEHPNEYVNEKDRSVLLYVPAGPFSMGSNARPELPTWLRTEEREMPVHTVKLSAYFVGKYEVTNEQFERFVAARGYVTRAETTGSGFAQFDVNIDTPVTPGARWTAPWGDARAANPREPVVQLAWDDARAYCEWAGLRLPTEAEWERAACWDTTANKSRLFPWGDAIPGSTPRKVANLTDVTFVRDARGGKRLPVPFDGYDDGVAWLAPVGSFPDGASPIGALDMAGNVYEWCQDGFDPEYYSHSPKTDPLSTNKDDANRVFRGGSYCSSRHTVRASGRYQGLALFTRSDLGFRVARAGK